MPRKPEERVNQMLERMIDDRPFKHTGRIYNTTITPSEETPGKFELSIHGVQMPGPFDTEYGAMTFVTGLLLGQTGVLEKYLESKSRGVGIPNNPISDK